MLWGMAVPGSLGREQCIFWWLQSALVGSSIFFALAASGDWVQKGSFLTAWTVPPLSSCSCSYAYGRGTAVGPQSGERCWPLLTRLWWAVAPLTKPRRWKSRRGVW